MSAIGLGNIKKIFTINANTQKQNAKSISNKLKNFKSYYKSEQERDDFLKKEISISTKKLLNDIPKNSMAGGFSERNTVFSLDEFTGVFPQSEPQKFPIKIAAHHLIGLELGFGIRNARNQKEYETAVAALFCYTMLVKEGAIPVDVALQELQMSFKNQKKSVELEGCKLLEDLVNNNRNRDNTSLLRYIVGNKYKENMFAGEFAYDFNNDKESGHARQGSENLQKAVPGFGYARLEDGDFRDLEVDGGGSDDKRSESQPKPKLKMTESELLRRGQHNVNSPVADDHSGGFPNTGNDNHRTTPASSGANRNEENAGGWANMSPAEIDDLLDEIFAEQAAVQPTGNPFEDASYQDGQSGNAAGSSSAEALSGNPFEDTPDSKSSGGKNPFED